MLAATVIASLAAVVGVATWVSEAPDRRWEREVRRATLAQSARDILNVQSGTLEPTFAVQRAIITLHELNEPVEIVAERVNLAGLVLPCGAYRISANEVHFNMTTVYRAYVIVKSPLVVINSSQFLYSELLTRSQNRTDTEAPPVSFFSSRALSTHFMFDDGAAVAFSTFENSRIRSWFGELDFPQVNARAPLVLPSFERTSWQDEAYIDFFDDVALAQARDGAEFFPRLSPDMYDAGRFLVEQRSSAQDVSARVSVLSNEWDDFCSSNAVLITCERTEPKIFELDRVPDDISPCSTRNEYADFDPLKFGDEPVLVRSKSRP